MATQQPNQPQKRKALNWRDKELADSIKRYRKDNDLTQEELSEKLGVNLTYISSVERYKRRISLAILYKLSILFKIKVKDLFTF